jgi:hypothetical protein
MTEIRKSGKHRPVIAKRPDGDISQEPEMKELKKIFGAMPDEEKRRTIDHLKEKDSPGER